MSIPVRPPVRLIDPRGQRFGAALSAIVLVVGVVLDLPIVVALVAVALGVSSALGTRYFVFGRPWPTVRSLLRLGPPAAPEPEVGPRFAQALGTTFLALGVRPARRRPATARLATRPCGRRPPDAARRDGLLPRLPAVRAPVVGARPVRPVRAPPSAGRRR